MGPFSIWHLLVIAIVALVLFLGWKQLPNMARSLGRSMRVFETEIKGMGEDDKARESHDEARGKAPRQLESRPAQESARPAQEAGQQQRPAPRAQVVRNEAAVPPPASGSRPRPTPNGPAASR